MTTTTIDVDEGTVRFGVALGLIRLASDGVHELTEEGSTYLQKWIAEKLADPK